MIYGIGTDICDISRIEKIYRRFGTSFVTKIFTEREERLMPRHGRAAWLAKRFAAKEAFAKALGTGFSEGLTFKDISITSNNKGAPEVQLTEKVMQKLPSSSRVLVSLSDEKGYALAFVVIEQMTTDF